MAEGELVDVRVAGDACSATSFETTTLVGSTSENIDPRRFKRFVKPHEASPANLGRALRPGGMVPELRAMRLKEMAARVKDECAGDLRLSLSTVD